MQTLEVSRQVLLILVHRYPIDSRARRAPLPLERPRYYRTRLLADLKQYSSTWKKTPAETLVAMNDKSLAAIEKHMMRDGFVLRHDPREISDETQPIEGAFLACTLWLADAFVLAGEMTKAQALFDRVVAVANDLGLLAEEFDSGAGRQTGNFPQALTHIALINTAHNLGDAKKPVDKPAMQRSK